MDEPVTMVRVSQAVRRELKRRKAAKDYRSYDALLRDLLEVEGDE